jgi:hypothetical protein
MSTHGIGILANMRFHSQSGMSFLPFTRPVLFILTTHRRVTAIVSRVRPSEKAFRATLLQLMPPVFFTLYLRSKEGDRHVSHTRIRPREWLLLRYEPDQRITFHVDEGIPQKQPRKKNPAKTLGLGPEVQAEVKNTQNGRRNFPFSALKTLG